MSETTPIYQCRSTLMIDIDQLRSMIAMYLRTGVGDEQGCSILKKTELLLRNIKEEWK